MNSNSSELLLLMTALTLALCGISWFAVAHLKARDRATAWCFVAFNACLGLGLFLKGTWSGTQAALAKSTPDLLILGSVVAVIYGVHAFQRTQAPIWTVPVLALLGAAGVIVFGLIVPDDVLRLVSVMGPFVVLGCTALARNASPIHREFGLPAACALSAAVLTSVVAMFALIVLIALGTVPIELHQAGHSNELAIAAIEISAIGLNMCYAYYMARRTWAHLHIRRTKRKKPSLHKILEPAAFDLHAEHLWQLRRAEGVTGALVTIGLRWREPPSHSSNAHVDDATVKAFTALFRSTFDTASLLGRTAHGDFAAVVAPASTARVTTLSERLIRRAQRERWPQSHLRLTLDIGMAFDVEQDSDAGSLFARAHDALSAARVEGLNCIVYA